MEPLTIGLICVAVALAVAYKVIDSRKSEADEAQATALKERGIWVGALVESFERTGMSINDIPQLAITFTAELDDDSIHRGTTKKLVDPLHAMHVQKGAKARFHYDPEDLSNFEFFLGFEESHGSSVAAAIRDQQTLQDRLAEVGLVGRATIRELTETKVEINEEGLMVVLAVTVAPTPTPGERTPAEPFDAEFVCAVAYSRLDNYRPGKQIWVRYDAENPTIVALDWKQQGGTTSTSDSEYNNL